MKHIYLTDSVIHYPKNNCIYHLKDGNSHETVVSFTGKSTAYCTFFDAASGGFCLIDGVYRTIRINGVCFLTNESLVPTATSSFPKLPLYLFHIATNEICAFTRLHLDLDELLPLTLNAIPLAKQPPFANTQLHDECTKVAGKIVTVGDYPIMDEVNKPTLELLSKLYRQFINFNPDEKLKHQARLSSQYCHTRAHFISELLNLYGINTVKLFKIWNQEDWAKFSKDISYSYHSAVMITDNNNNNWVWDPWEGLNHYLLSLKDWLFRKNEPQPIELIVGNRVVNNPQSYGNVAYGSRFSLLDPVEFRIFQAVADDALPKPSPALSLMTVGEKAIHRRQLGLFKPKTESATQKTSSFQSITL